MLAVVIVCGRSKPRQRRRRAFAAEVICLTESGMISVRRRGRDYKQRGSDGRHAAFGC